jgi:hypothetical protein
VGLFSRFDVALSLGFASRVEEKVAVVQVLFSIFFVLFFYK